MLSATRSCGTMQTILQLALPCASAVKLSPLVSQPDEAMVPPLWSGPPRLPTPPKAGLPQSAGPEAVMHSTGLSGLAPSTCGGRAGEGAGACACSRTKRARPGPGAGAGSSTSPATARLFSQATAERYGRPWPADTSCLDRELRLAMPEQAAQQAQGHVTGTL